VTGVVPALSWNSVSMSLGSYHAPAMLPALSWNSVDRSVTVTVQPRDRSVSIAATPVEDGREPPDWSNTRVPVAMPDVTSDTRMLSMLVWVRAVFVNASVKSPPFTLSKMFAGKLVRLEQSRQARPKLVPDEVSIRGKDVRPVQPRQA